jgi:hypothetical protein
MTTFSGKHCELSKKKTVDLPEPIDLQIQVKTKIKFLKESKGYEINNGMISFDYKSPLYWQEDNLAFAIETKSSDALLFRATSGRNNKTILIELVFKLVLKSSSAQQQNNKIFKSFFSHLERWLRSSDV